MQSTNERDYQGQWTHNSGWCLASDWAYVAIDWLSVAPLPETPDRKFPVIRNSDMLGVISKHERKVLRFTHVPQTYFCDYKLKTRSLVRLNAVANQLLTISIPFHNLKLSKGYNIF